VGLADAEEEQGAKTNSEFVEARQERPRGALGGVRLQILLEVHQTGVQGAADGVHNGRTKVRKD